MLDDSVSSGMNDSPSVSVVLPTYNGGPFLWEAVESVFAQTYGHWELVVVDDWSTDGTRTFLAGLPTRGSV